MRHIGCAIGSAWECPYIVIGGDSGYGGPFIFSTGSLHGALGIAFIYKGTDWGVPVRRGVCQVQLGEVSVLIGGVFWED